MAVFPNSSQYNNYNRVNAIIIKRNGCKTVQIAIKVRLYVTMAQSTRCCRLTQWCLNRKSLLPLIRSGEFCSSFVETKQMTEIQTRYLFSLSSTVRAYAHHSHYAIPTATPLWETWLIVNRLRGMRTVTRDCYKQQSASPSINLLLGFCVSRDKAKNTGEIKSTSAAKQIHTQMLPTHIQTSTSI